MATDRHTHLNAKQLKNFDLTFDDLAPEVKTGTIGVIFTNEPNPISAGAQIDVEVPFSATITNVTMLADTTGSITIDIFKDPYSSFPSTTSITASDLPTITASNKSKNSTLTGWTKTISAGDTLRFSVTSNATITRCLINLTITRT